LISTFLPRHVDRAFSNDRDDRIAISTARSVALVATDTGMLWVEHGWVSARYGATPYLSFGPIADVRSSLELAMRMIDCRLTAYASDEPFNPNAFRPCPFTWVDLEILLSLAELRLAALLAAGSVAFHAQSPGLREALLSHSPTDDVLPAVLRLALVSSVGYAPWAKSAGAAAKAFEGGIVTQRAGAHAYGAQSSNQAFVNQLVSSMQSTFQPNR
jgi:hypothetical protein